MMGESLGSMTAKDLKNLESKLEKGISRIRSKKVCLVMNKFLSVTFERIEGLFDLYYLLNPAFF